MANRPREENVSRHLNFTFDFIPEIGHHVYINPLPIFDGNGSICDADLKHSNITQICCWQGAVTLACPRAILPWRRLPRLWSSPRRGRGVRSSGPNRSSSSARSRKKSGPKMRGGQKRRARVEGEGAGKDDESLYCNFFPICFQIHCTQYKPSHYKLRSGVRTTAYFTLQNTNTFYVS